MMDALDRAIANTQAHLDALRNASGHWEGRLSSSALSTATAIVALALVDRDKHALPISAGARWRCEHQNAGTRALKMLRRRGGIRYAGCVR
jgi:squalene-hopene/tetraprenyl-beta-curcumene cyclase